MNVTLILLTGCIAFVGGYITGRLDSLLSVLRNQQSGAPQGFFAKTEAGQRRPAPNAIEIDSRKVVSPIKTDTLQNVTQVQLGKQIVAADDIHASVNKLAQLKGK